MTDTTPPIHSVEISGKHPFIAQISRGISTLYCGVEILRDGEQTACGLPKSDVIHTRPEPPATSPEFPSPIQKPMIQRGKQPPLPSPPLLMGSAVISLNPAHTFTAGSAMITPEPRLTLPPFKRAYISHPIAGVEPKEVEFLETEGSEFVSRQKFIPVLPRTIQPWCEQGPGRKCPAGPPGVQGQVTPHTRTCYIRGDLVVLLQCDAVLMMPNWEMSWGCTVELNTAVAAGISVQFYP